MKHIEAELEKAGGDNLDKQFIRTHSLILFNNRDLNRIAKKLKRMDFLLFSILNNLNKSREKMSGDRTRNNEQSKINN